MNHWDTKYDSSSYVYGKEANVFVKEHFKHSTHKDKSVLLLAEGEGRNAVYLASLGYDVTTYDFSKIGIEKQLKLAKGQDVHINANYGDITDRDLLPKDRFDVTVNVFGHVQPSGKESMIDNLITPLVKNGYSYFELYSADQLEYGTGGPANKDMLFTVSEIKTYIGKHDVEIHTLEKKVLERYEGTGHFGEASVIQGHVEKKVET